VAAVERERAALDEPERTPSARLLADLAAERLTFIEHALELARRHHSYFVDLPLSAAREQWFADVAARSLAEAAALERKQQPPFAEYLETHFAEA
jgi:glutamate--cysteine ligase